MLCCSFFCMSRRAKLCQQNVVDAMVFSCFGVELTERGRRDCVFLVLCGITQPYRNPMFDIKNTFFLTNKKSPMNSASSVVFYQYFYATVFDHTGLHRGIKTVF